MRRALKSSSETTSIIAGQAAVENIKILIADAHRCADYDLATRLERILKKVEVLIRNLEAAGRGGYSQSGHGKQAPFEASYSGTFRVAPHRPIADGPPETADLDGYTRQEANPSASSHAPGKPRTRRH